MAPRSLRRGQILIPALLVFPLFLFVLLLDPGRRARIRRQFTDAAANERTSTPTFNRIATSTGFPREVQRHGRLLAGLVPGLFRRSQ